MLTANLSRISCELALCARISSTLRFRSGASAFETNVSYYKDGSMRWVITL